MDIVLSPVLLAAIPIVIGVVSLIKSFGMDSKWAGLLSLVMGLFLSFLAGGSNMLDVVLQGLVVGLSASGLYSSTKSTVKGLASGE